MSPEWTKEELRAQRDEARAALDRVRALCDDRFGGNDPVPVWHSQDVRALVRAALDGGRET